MSDETAKTQAPGWRYRLGLILFILPFPAFFLTPIVIPLIGLSAAETSALIGAVVVGIEVMWFASIPLLGKQGFLDLKAKAFGWLKLKDGPISRARHRFGVGLLVVSLGAEMLLTIVVMVLHFEVASVAEPTPEVAGISFGTQANLWIAVELLTFVGVVAAAFILGGDFWERLKKAFQWQGGIDV